MRRLQSVLLAGLFAASLSTLFADPSAATVTKFGSATLGTALSTLPPYQTTAIGSVLSSVNGLRSAGGKITAITGIPASMFTLNGFLVPITDPAAAPIAGLQITQANQAGAFAVTGGHHLAGQMPMNGVNKVCLFSACDNTLTPPPANLTVPIDVVGAGGAVSVSTLVNITALGAPWTTATASVGTISMKGFAHNITNTASASKIDIKLVTPIFISTNIGASAVVPAFSMLEFKGAAPEPAVALGFGAAITTLLALGRQRMRKS